ncbi:hypothetical protein LINPERPRIM_LOCUS7720 [Linum perenne]
MQKLVLEHGWTPQKVVDEYKDSFLLTADKCKKVYLPMNDANTHWNLAVILMDKKEAHMVDSLPDVMRHDIRLKAVANMVKFMGELFNILYAKGESSETVPKVADFEIKVPSFVPTQCNTYDCGLWLTTWMTYHDHPFEYNVGGVYILSHNHFISFIYIKRSDTYLVENLFLRI